MLELLLDPNVAYLLLVVGSLLVIAALFSPGSGVLEVGAFFLMLIAGWVIYQSSINPWALVVLVLGVIPFLLALRRSRRMAFLIVAILAFILGSTFLFTEPDSWRPVVHPLLAITVSGVTSFLLWWIAVRVLEIDRRPPSHDLEQLVGAVGEARTPVDAEGSVYVAGELWSATSRQPIPVRAKVRVTGRSGNLLQVEPLTSSPDPINSPGENTP